MSDQMEKIIIVDLRISEYIPKGVCERRLEF